MRQLLDADPANADILNYLGYMLANQGRQLDEAIRLVQQALDVDPGNRRISTALAGRISTAATSDRRRSPGARRAATAAQRHHPGSPWRRACQARAWQDAIAAWTARARRRQRRDQSRRRREEDPGREG
jgi:tetratricopeptide (TPR) repeat protein